MLREDGMLAVWPWVPLWLPDAVVGPGLFAYTGREGGVSRFVRMSGSDQPAAIESL